MDDMDLEQTLVMRVDDIRKIAEIDIETLDGELPPAALYRYNGLACLILADATVDSTGAASLSIEVTWWNGDQLGYGPTVYNYARDEPLPEQEN